MQNVCWETFKSFIIKKNLQLSYLEENNIYLIWAYDGPFCLQCILLKDSSDNTIDFEMNYKNN